MEIWDNETIPNTYCNRIACYLELRTCALNANAWEPFQLVDFEQVNVSWAVSSYVQKCVQIILPPP